MTNNNTNIATARRTHRASAFAAGLLLAFTAAVQTSLAQDNPQGQNLITPNYKDTEIGVIIEAVSEITGRNFIIDPRVRANVTMVSRSPLTPDAFYEAFLAVLQVHGFVAVPSGQVIKIIPDANARQVPANDLPDSVSSTSDEVVTQVIAIRNVSAAQLVPILRPLIPQYGHLAAYPASNMLIISDRANNVNRMIRIIRRIDQGGDEEVDVFPLEHASAAEVVRVVNALYPPGAQAEGGTGVKLVADERTNSVLVSGEKAARLRLKTLVAHLDTPLEAGGDTQVRYLRYADAEKIAAKLKDQATATAAVTGGAPPQGGAPAGGGPSAQLDKNVTIWADPETNALVITAPPKIMRSLMQIIDKIDVRREQVEVEAIIVEVSTTKAAELGVNWLVDGSGDNFLVGGFIQPLGTNAGTIIDTIRLIDDPTATGAVPPSGLTLGGGQINETGTSFAAILRALRSDTDTNIIATPHIITMDNQEAQIKDAREVPFITGQFTNTGTVTGGEVTPFQTIQRQEVGIILKLTPKISESDTVQLKIEQESSDIAPAVAGAVDVVTIKRTISTNVLVEDGAILVLGGLIRDRVSGGESRVPFLGKIPVLGNLFKVQNSQKEKTVLMVFIKPKILRTGEQTAIQTNDKYDRIRDTQQGINKGKVRLLPRETQPLLPPLPPANLNPKPFSEDAPASNPDNQASPPATTYPTPPDSTGATEPPVASPPPQTSPPPQNPAPPPSAPPPNSRRPPQESLPNNSQPQPPPSLPPEA
ncbi:MAG TPA: type II secretion system secretin GspD [Steroidobacteraceae bacterium]|nr:type II secretion system secretin GspD [Steroidobacteraceae bacterium]